MRKTGFVYDDIFLKHNTGSHPENSSRLQAIVSGLQRYELWDHLTHLAAQTAAPELISTVHDPKYVLKVKDYAEGGGGYLDPDTVVSSQSYEAALYAAGGACTAVDAVMTGKVNNAFVAARPPGHHAENAKAMGFCLFNNVAIAAQYAREKFDCKKVMIIDWDAHHGNGTQRAFYGSRQVLYFSTHQQGIFPGTGYVGETGMGEGDGYNINVPLAKDTGDAGFYFVFKQLCQPVILQFQPELILISCGFDTHYSDPLADLNMTTHGFKQLTNIVLEAADEVCAGKVVAVLEGGYNLENLGHCAAAVVSRMAGLAEDVREPGQVPEHTIKPTMRMPIDEALQVHKRYWKL